MVVRMWRGVTSPENGKAYEALIDAEIISLFASKNVKGYKGFKLLKKALHNEVEWVTLIMFDSMTDVIEFIGPDYEKAWVLPEAQKLLSRYDSLVTHYEVIQNLDY